MIVPLEPMFTTADALAWLNASADALDATPRQHEGVAATLTVQALPEALTYIRVSDAAAALLASTLRAVAVALTPAPSTGAPSTSS